MTSRKLTALFAVIVSILAVIFVTIPQALAAQQNSSSAASAQPYDLSGVWFTQGGKVRSNFVFKGISSLTPWAEQQMEAHHQELSPLLRCLPPGVPRIWTMPQPFEIISLPGRVLVYYEFDHLVRQIHTDGRDHPKDLLPTWMGDSIGKWDGDTLVVDTVGFNEGTWIDNTGLPHSDALHVVERLRRTTHDALQLDITIDDPKAYTKPWTAQRMYDLKPGWEIGELVCEDNNIYMPGPEKK